MLRPMMMALAMGIAMLAMTDCQEAAAQDYRVAGTYGNYGSANLQRFYHYPYVTYPHNYWGSEYYRSNGDMYHRYPQEMRIPVYNRSWHNYYPSSRRYHWGHHFILDVF